MRYQYVGIMSVIALVEIHLLYMLPSNSFQLLLILRFALFVFVQNASFSATHYPHMGTTQR